MLGSIVIYISVLNTHDFKVEMDSFEVKSYCNFLKIKSLSPSGQLKWSNFIVNTYSGSYYICVLCFVPLSKSMGLEVNKEQQQKSPNSYVTHHVIGYSHQGQLQGQGHKVHNFQAFVHSNTH